MKCFISMQRLNCLFACAVKIRQVHKNLRRTTLHTHTDTHSTPYATVANKCFCSVYLEAAPCIHINTITASKWNFTVENPKRNNNNQYSHWNTQNECRILFIHRFAVILIVKLTKYICIHEFFSHRIFTRVSQSKVCSLKLEQQSCCMLYGCIYMRKHLDSWVKLTMTKLLK